MCFENQLIVARSVVLALLAILNVGLLPLGQSPLEAGWTDTCTAVTPCPATAGWCLGLAGTAGTCGSWGFGCTGGLPKCLGTISPLAPAPLLPGAVCNGARGC